MVGEIPPGTKTKSGLADGVGAFNLREKKGIGCASDIVGERLGGDRNAFGTQKEGELLERNPLSDPFREDRDRRFERAGVADSAAMRDVAKKNGTKDVDQTKSRVGRIRAVRDVRHAAPKEVVAPEFLFRRFGTNLFSNRTVFPEGVGRDFERHRPTIQKACAFLRKGINVRCRNKEVADVLVEKQGDDPLPTLDVVDLVEKDREALFRDLRTFENEPVQNPGVREAPQRKVFAIEKEEIFRRAVELLAHVLGDQAQKTRLSGAAKAGQHLDAAVLIVGPDPVQKGGTGKKLHRTSL